MSATTSAGPEPEGRGLQPPDFGRPSPALLARADRGYARFLAPTTSAAPDDGDQDDAARQR
ncbi:hypothetical protein P8A21_40845 (plasmid) [Streptomyces poriferorum]|uniref:hypothetical protein n=1 Tax=Streptomyces poriferorum TaxID=2798799 RepID=UPI0027402DAA|nr:hypothetical protein [Streptomyces sp. Alt1]WLQ53867.1 hypothetical protein P8A21_40845 [Streptomyces sp. Alt1]